MSSYETSFTWIDYSCKALLTFSLILKKLDSVTKHVSDTSSKNMYFVQSISKILAAAFWEAGSPIGATARVALQATLLCTLVLSNRTQCLFH